MADSGGDVALPEIRELLFADLPPLTAMETFAAVADLRDLAQAAAREDEPAAREILARIVDGTTESRVRLQAWSLARRVGIEPSSDDARRVRGVVVDVGFDAGTDTLAGYEDGTARYLNQGGGGIVWETADETIGASIQALIAGRSGGGRAKRPARRSAAARAAERRCLDLAPHRRRDPPRFGSVRGPRGGSARWTGDRSGDRADAAAHRAERNRPELTASHRPSRGTRRGGGSAPPGAQSRPHDCDSCRADRAPWRAP